MKPYLLITIQRGREQHDIEVSADMTAEELCQAVDAAYGWGRNSGAGNHNLYLLVNLATGRRLQPTETLANARVWTGSQLLFQIQAAAAPSQPRSVPAQAAVSNPPPGRQGSPAIAPDQQQADTKPAIIETPVIRWRTLGNEQDAPATDQPPEAEELDRKNFTWKRLD
jgi:hypothetical protein